MGDDPRSPMRDQELARECEKAHPVLVRLLTLRTGDREVALELAQDALVELVRAWPDVERPQAWVVTVALRRSASWWRRRGAERRAMARHGPDAVLATPVPVADHVALVEAVAELPRRQQEALLLRAVAGLSVAETARSMGCAEGTITSLTHRATTRLAALTDEDREADHVR